MDDPLVFHLILIMGNGKREPARVPVRVRVVVLRVAGRVTGRIFATRGNPSVSYLL